MNYVFFMSKFIRITSYFLLLSVLLFQSCKTDEFKFDEITVKEGFGVKIIAPLYTGKDKNGDILEFKDFIRDWKKPIADPSGPFTVLKYSDDSYKTIPTRLIFDPSVIINDLELSIKGNYTFGEIELIFTVSNSCPFPLNLQLQFLVSNSLNNTVPPISPPPFNEADFSQIPVLPVVKAWSVNLDSLQLKNFNDSKSIRLTSWYDETIFINQNDTLWAHYPIDVSIVMIGVVQPSK